MSEGFNYRILVVDDEPSIREVSSNLLETKGYEVRTATDGFAALVELRRAPPDIIISDLKMPNMSGFELLSIVRRRFPQIPVIAISGEYNGLAPQGSLRTRSSPKPATRPSSSSRRSRTSWNSLPSVPTSPNPTVLRYGCRGTRKVTWY